MEGLNIGGGGHGNLDDDNEDDDDWFVFSGYEPSTANDSHMKGKDVKQRSTKIQNYSAQQGLEEIEGLYYDERDDLVRQAVQAAHEDVQEPYSLFLHIMHCAFFDMYSKRLLIMFLTLDEFEIWLELKITQGEQLF